VDAKNNLSRRFIMVESEKRVTMLLDKGIGLRSQRDLLETAAPYITQVKIGWGIGNVLPEKILKAKITLYREAGIIVSPGGTALEKAIFEDKIDQFSLWLRDSGFNAVEVSNGVVELGEDEKCDLIRDFNQKGFIVLSEVGSKDPASDRLITITDRVEATRAELDAGSQKVIVEAREGGKGIGFFDIGGSVISHKISQFLELVDWRAVIFEAPLKHQQVFFIKKIGADVNLGNIAHDEILSLETLRRGLRGDTLKIFETPVHAREEMIR